MAAKGKILVVDDDRLVLAMVTHGLSFFSKSMTSILSRCWSEPV